MRRLTTQRTTTWLMVGLGVLIFSESWAKTSDSENTLMDLEDFIIYAEPEVMDALRNRPYSKKNEVVEAFFHALPSINNQIYDENIHAMRSYLQKAKRDKDRKLSRLSALAGLSYTPAGLIDGYQDRLDVLDTLLKWMERQQPIQLKRINVWKESDLRYRLARKPLENVRINPETDEVESRLFFNWNLIFQDRPKARDLRLDFEMGIQLQEQTGFYNPKGFLHLTEIDRRDLKPFEVTYPVILSEELQNNLDAELPAYLSAYRTTMDSFYHILQEYFFSDLADVHALYILARGEIFADEWGQYQSTALQRGLAANVVFQAFEESLGKTAVRELQKNDWTTWHIRKIGSRYNPIIWEEESAPANGFGNYKESFNLRNIYWSTLLVQFLADRYGDRFVFSMCEEIKKSTGKSPPNDALIFRRVTGDELEPTLQEFVDLHSKG